MKLNNYKKFINENKFSSKDELINHINKLKNDPEYKKKIDTEKSIKLKEYWKKLSKFKKSTDVPKLPNPLTYFYEKRLIELGAIPKSELVDGKWYYGNFRNSNYGKWDSNESVFKHIRCSFGYYWDKCNHFQDDDGFALFVPLREATNEEIKNELKKVETSK